MNTLYPDGKDIPLPPAEPTRGYALSVKRESSGNRIAFAGTSREEALESAVALLDDDDVIRVALYDSTGAMIFWASEVEPDGERRHWPREPR